MSKMNDKKAEYLRNFSKLRTHGHIKVLLFGSSIVKHLWGHDGVWDSHLKDLCAFNLGISGAKASFTRDCIKESPIERKNLPNLEVVVIHVGSNDASTTRCCWTVAREVATCALEVNFWNPNVRVIISSLLPRLKTVENSYGLGDENRVISDINDLLKKYCSRYGFTFMENWTTLDKSLYRRDGVHLTKEGNTLFAINIRDTVNSFRIHADPGHIYYTPTTAIAIAKTISSADKEGMDGELHSLAVHHAGKAISKFAGESSTTARLSVAAAPDFVFPLIPQFDACAIAHTSIAAKYIAAAVGVDLKHAFPALLDSHHVQKPFAAWLRKTIQSVSSDDTDDVSHYKERRKKVRGKSRQEKKR